MEKKGDDMSAAHPPERDKQTLFRLEELTKIFGEGEEQVTAIQDIDLTIRSGEIFGIIGLSGAGKSTLIRCLNLLERPSSGKVIFRGVDLQSLSKKELLQERQKIGMIFQNFNLLQQRTALENVRFPLEISGMGNYRATQKAREMLQLVGLPEKERAYPTELSGGQQQRVAIARALASEPDVLLCDEATSALDPATTKSILELLKSINETLGVTIIMITHEMSVVQAICNRVAVIDTTIAEVGDVDEVFLRPASRIARELIFPKGELLERLQGSRYLRIVFDGTAAHEPIIANMTLACQTPVSILSADSRNIDGIAYGQMIIQIPEDQQETEKILSYLTSRGVTVEEVTEATAQNGLFSEEGRV
jgi:D-methionine transport system ATP-binding protein